MTAPIIPADQWPDEFKGDNAKLIGCINALLSMDAAGALVPHGIGGHARSLLAAAAHRLAPDPAIDLEQYAVAIQYAVNGMREAGGITNGKVADKLASLLALIDGQASQGCGACGDGCVARGSCRVRDESPPCNSEQLTKGEGE